MHRAGKRSVVALVACLVLALFPRAALAFHAGSLFDKPSGAGGGGKIFYTGSPKEKGWHCGACHLDAPGKIQIVLEADQGLFQSFAYTPGMSYDITATLIGEHAGTQSATANFNGLAMTVVDESGEPAGSLSGPADDFYSSGPATIVTSGQKVAQTKWSLRWRAPDTAIGAVTIHVAAVDGNAAGLSGDTLTDPWDDDVFVGALALDAAAGKTAQRFTPRSSTLGEDHENASIAFDLGNRGVLERREQRRPVPARHLRRTALGDVGRKRRRQRRHQRHDVDGVRRLHRVLDLHAVGRSRRRHVHAHVRRLQLLRHHQQQAHRRSDRAA